MNLTECAYKNQNNLESLNFSISILNNNNIRILVLPNKFDIYNDIARIMVDKLKENNNKGSVTSFILPVGPRGQYNRFARICNEEKVTCRNLITINMDEYLGKNNKYIEMDNPLSFRNFMSTNLFNLIDTKLSFKKENIFFPNPGNLQEITKVLFELGGADICFGGIGINGHIAFNEPIKKEEISLSEFKKLSTRIVDLSYETKIMNSLKNGGSFSVFPSRCITIGIKEILMSRELRFYFEHNWQYFILLKAIFSKVSPEFPITVVRDHKNSCFIISEEVLQNHVNTEYFL